MEVYIHCLSLIHSSSSKSSSKKSLSSSALGDNFLKYVNMEGRVVIDLMKEVQKGHNLDTYKLDFVAQHFINGKIKDIKYNPTDNKHYLTIDNPTGIQNGIYIRIVAISIINTISPSVSQNIT